MSIAAIMKVLVIGHSYVRDLSEFYRGSFVVEGTSFELKYLYKPGASYESLIDNTELFQDAIAYVPDYTVVILAGNSLKLDVGNSTIFHQCKSFYMKLRTELPSTKIIAAQVELRFYEDSNKWNAPGIEEYKRRRSYLNKFLSKLKVRDGMLLVAGPHRLDNECYYRDAVHLNSVGIRKYFNFLKSTVAYMHRKNN